VALLNDAVPIDGMTAGDVREATDALLARVSEGRSVALTTHENRTFERGVTVAALAAAPVMVVVGAVAMALSPRVFAECNATGPCPRMWLGASSGLALALVVYALPQLLFGLALRSGRRRPLRATAIAAPLFAAFLLVTTSVNYANGFSGVSGTATVMVTAAGLLDVLVFVAALRALRRTRAEPR